MFAVLQLHDDPPPLEALANAFRASRAAAVADAARIVIHNTGFIAENLDLESAAKLQSLLAAEGVQAAVVDVDDIPPLPRRMSAPRLDCRADSLVVHDALGRTRGVAWPAVSIVGVGDVGKIKHIVRVKVGQSSGDAQSGAPDTEYEEKSEQRPTLAFHIGGEDCFYLIDSETFLYTPLGSDKVTSRRHGLVAFFGDVVRQARGAALNRGARALAENPKRLVRYPSRPLFERELRWLLWRSTGKAG